MNTKQTDLKRFLAQPEGPKVALGDHVFGDNPPAVLTRGFGGPTQGLEAAMNHWKNSMTPTAAGPAAPGGGDPQPQNRSLPSYFD